MIYTSGWLCYTGVRMALTRAQVQHIATLARLALTDAEVDKFTKQLTDILGYVAQLNEVDTEGVLPTSQVTGLKNVMRDDVVQDFIGKDPLLACTQLPVERDQITVLSVFDS